MGMVVSFTSPPHDQRQAGVEKLKWVTVQMPGTLIRK
jgi:hypothetical protein